MDEAHRRTSDADVFSAGALSTDSDVTDDPESIKKSTGGRRSARPDTSTLDLKFVTQQPLQ